MLVTTWIGKLYITDWEMRKKEPMSLAVLRQGHFCFRQWKDLEKQVFYKKLFRVITVSPALFKGEVKSILRDISNAENICTSFSHIIK